MDGVIRKWKKAFNDGRKNVHDEERIGRYSVITDELVQKVAEKVEMNKRFTISAP